jgi:YaiO family outer membrane protein
MWLAFLWAIGSVALRAETHARSPRSVLDQAKDLERRQQYPEASAAYRAYLDVRPDDDDARGAVARLLSWQGAYDDALAEYRDVLTRHPLDLEIQTAVARILSWQKKFDEAQQMYESVLRDDPDRWDAVGGLADVLFWSGRGRDALPYYERLFASSRDPEIAARMETIHADLAVQETDSKRSTRRSDGLSDDSLRQAHQLEEDGRYAEAIAGYRAYLSRQPDDDEVRTTLARVLSWRGNHAEAIVLYRDVLTRHPGDLDVRLALALTLSWQKQFTEARQIYGSLLAESAYNREARKGLADIAFWSGDRVQALARYESLYQEDPDPEVARQIAAVKAELATSPRAPVGQEVGGLRLPYRDYAKIGYGHYSYTKGIPDERNVLLEAGTSVGNKTLIARIEPLTRFGFHDTPVSAELYSPLWRQAWGYVGAQVTANPSFAPNYSAVGEAFQGLGAVHSSLSALEVSVGYRHLLFKKDNIDLFLPGVTVYFPHNVWLTEKLYYVPDTGAITLASQLTWRPQDRLQFFASWAFGTSGERIVATQDFTRVRSRIVQGGVTFPLTARLSAEASGYYEDRGALYVRRGGLFNLIVHW